LKSRGTPSASAHSEFVPIGAIPAVRFPTCRNGNLFYPVPRSNHAGDVPAPLNPNEVLNAVRAALAEDVGNGDATTLSTVPAESRSHALMRARERLVVAGLDFAAAAFRELSPNLEIVASKADGERAQSGEVLLTINGSTRAILTAERVALNFVQRLSGVATAAAQYVEAVRGLRAQILDTRKTTPGWRNFEKYAVTCGGARSHRIGLYDMVLIKDNHLAALKAAEPNPVAVAVLRARTQYPQLKVEVEADTLEQVSQAVEAGADFILLDNMTPAQLRTAVELVGGRTKTEASGGVNIQTVRAIAESGVDFISVGAVTHSARAVDIGLDFDA
jgi:nicotinate-nucleotide pyrophosphorylase (carboxylating)